MKKRWMSLLLTFTMFLTLAMPVMAAPAIPATVRLDKIFLYETVLGGKAEVVNGRTMVPIRGIAELLGADVDWIESEQKVIMTRANHTVEMRVGDQTAYVDGEAVVMDIAPCVTNGRTRIPARYMAEFFGQAVTWDAARSMVDIQEDYSIVGDSNLEEWAIPMGAMLKMINHEIYTVTGKIRSDEFACRRGSWDETGQYVVERARDGLASGWGLVNREELIGTILSMTEHGHNDTFLELAQSNYADSYTKQVYNKYGNKGILAWDLFRMSNVAQWGYESGYVTYAEALALIQPAAQGLKDNFSSWEEAYENYLYGYCWWSDTGVAGQDIYQTERGKIYKSEIKENFEFDNSLFSKPIIPIPGVSAEDLRKEIM